MFRRQVIGAIATLAACTAAAIAQSAGPAAAPPASPAAPTVPTTKFTGDLGYVDASGNTKLTTLSVGDKLVHTDGAWTLTQLAVFVYGTTDSKVSASQLRVALRADLALDPRVGTFAGAEYERNRFAGFSSRLIAIGGVAWKALVAPVDSMAIDAGGELTRQSNVDGTTEDYPSARVAATYTHVFSKAAYAHEFVEYLPNLQTGGAYRVDTETALVAPVSAHVAVKCSFTVRYDSHPPVGFGGTDRVLRTGVQLSF